MFSVDDPLLALILRFVADTDGEGSTDQEFLQRQLKALRRHLAQFPEEEHGSRALDWIGQHAARYRRDWELNAVASRTVYLRCADCPLENFNSTEYCQIHEQWLYLLHRYLANELTTRSYVEEALGLLREYKNQHKLRLAAVFEHPSKSKKPKKTKRDGDKKAKKQKNGKKNK
jgi:hypothetical protein